MEKDPLHCPPFSQGQSKVQTKTNAAGSKPLPLDPKTMKNEGFTPQNMGYNP